MTLDISEDSYSALRASLLNKSGTVPLHERFRALFTLKSLKTDQAIEIISEGVPQTTFFDAELNINLSGFKDESALLKHELAYCLGQIKNEKALPVLESVLRDRGEDPMVRHEVGAYALIHYMISQL